MSNPIKLSPEEIQTINSLQTKYADITAKLGQLKIEQILLNSQVNRLAQLEETFSNEYLTIQTEEIKFADDVTKKYGQGEINIETGEFTPSV
jgi:hypothetical protein